MSRRLSCISLPRATAISTFTRPSLKYIRVGTSVTPFSRTWPSSRSISRRGSLLERGGLLDRHTRDSGVLEREPAQDRRLARRLLRLLEPGRLQPGRIEQPADDGRLGIVARERARERAEQPEPVLVDRRL